MSGESVWRYQFKRCQLGADPPNDATFSLDPYISNASHSVQQSHAHTQLPSMMLHHARQCEYNLGQSKHKCYTDIT